MQPKGREFSNDMAGLLMANSTLIIKFFTMMAYITEYHDSKFAIVYSAG